MMWCWGGFFFKCILKYLCESLQIHCFVLQNDWIVKYKIELINQFVTIIFTHKQLYNTRQCFASNLHLIYIGVKDKLFFSKKNKSCSGIFLAMRKTFYTLWTAVSVSEKWGEYLMIFQVFGALNATFWSRMGFPNLSISLGLGFGLGTCV